jgi:CDP-paratose 2-epimerase
VTKTSLITGGCGFLGSNLAARLLERGERVAVFDNLSRAGSAENLRWLQGLGAVDWIHGDTADAAVLGEAVKRVRPAVVYHLAGQVAMTTSVRDPLNDFRTNVLGTMNLLEILRLHWPEAALIYSSSNKVYGKLGGIRLVEEAKRYEAPDHPRGLDESTPLDFRTPYGCSKGAADQYVLEYARTYQIPTVVFRHSTIYGGRQHSTYDQGWVGWFCLQALVQKKDPTVQAFTISGNGKQVRDLLYVDDAVQAYLLAAEKMDKVRGEAFNIGGGMANSSSLLELFRELESLLGVRLRFNRIDWRHEDQKFFVADFAKIHSATGWHPVVAKQDGVSRTLHWLRDRVS